jgi:hypothetical protein
MVSCLEEILVALARTHLHPQLVGRRDVGRHLDRKKRKSGLGEWNVDLYSMGISGS